MPAEQQMDFQDFQPAEQQMDLQPIFQIDHQPGIQPVDNPIVQPAYIVNAASNPSDLWYTPRRWEDAGKARDA
jgi:hypothetical protein